MYYFHRIVHVRDCVQAHKIALWCFASSEFKGSMGSRHLYRAKKPCMLIKIKISVIDTSLIKSVF